MSAQVFPTPAELSVIWHDAECGYSADLALWRRLAAAAAGPVLDLGAGTGRVALDLADAGANVTAVDTDRVLLDELGRRAAARGLSVAAEVADARALDLDRGFALAVAPSQFLQLFPTPDERRALLRSVRSSLDAGGHAAFAIVEDPPTAEENGIPLPDVREIDGWVFSSQPLWAGRVGDEIVVRRLRQWVSPGGELAEEDDEVHLALLTAAQLEQEAADCGFRPVARHAIDETEHHVEATVVELEAT
jgi:SAM-dependent methyltransferase